MKDDNMTINTGGNIVHHGRGQEPIVRTPQKSTGNIVPEKPSGLAKASPNFKPLETKEGPKTPEEEAKAIAKAIEKQENKPFNKKEKTN